MKTGVLNIALLALVSAVTFSCSSQSGSEHGIGFQLDENYRLKVSTFLADPRFWNIDQQKAVYRHLLENKDFDTIDRLYKLLMKMNNEGRTIGARTEVYNPILLAIDLAELSSVKEIYSRDPRTVLSGNIEQGNIEIAPVVYSVKHGWEDTSIVEYLLSLKIGDDRIREMYGRGNIGGSFIENLLTYSSTDKMTKFLVSKGIEAVWKTEPTKLIFEDSINVYSDKSVTSSIILHVTIESTVEFDQMTYGKFDGFQWFHVRVGVTEGWVPETVGVYYDTGI